MRLQRLSTAAIDINNNTVGVTRKIHAGVDLNLLQLFSNLLVLLGLSFANVWLESTGNRRHFLEKFEFAFIKAEFRRREALDQPVQHMVQGWLDGIGNQRLFVFERICINIPDDLVRKSCENFAVSRINLSTYPRVSYLSVCTICGT